MKLTIALSMFAVTALMLCLTHRGQQAIPASTHVVPARSTVETHPTILNHWEDSASVGTTHSGAFAAADRGQAEITELAKEQVQQSLTTLDAMPPGPARDEQHSLLLHRLAALDGLAAVTALLASPDEDFKKGQLGSLLAVWADHDPMAALFWYHAPEQDALADAGFAVAPRFYATTFRAMTKAEFSATVQAFPAIEGEEQRLAAMESIIRTAREMGRLGDMLDALGRSETELSPKEIALASKVAGEP